MSIQLKNLKRSGVSALLLATSYPGVPLAASTIV